jgi:hypothetical protein
MYLIDTNVISELRKKSKANPGVINFFKDITDTGDSVFSSRETRPILKEQASS